MPDRLFRDRRDAGRALAGLLEHYRNRPDVIVLGLPRGGVPVAYEVAMALSAPLDIFVVRKLGVPGREEVAMGAIASGGVVVLNDDVVRGLGISPEVIQQVAEREGRELVRREQAYREGRPMPDLTGRTVILVDDGLATGASMRAAIQALRQLKPGRIVVAVPAAPESTCTELSEVVDEVVCATTPSPFFAVGQSYWNFDQTTDEEVRDLLRAASQSRPVGAGAEAQTEVAVIRSVAALVENGVPPEDAFLMLCFDSRGTEMRITHATLHASLRRAIELVTRSRVLNAIRSTDSALRRLGLGSPRIAVSGLNPHAGEGGLFGEEERAYYDEQTAHTAVLRDALAAEMSARLAPVLSSMDPRVTAVRSSVSSAAPLLTLKLHFTVGLICMSITPRAIQELLELAATRQTHCRVWSKSRKRSRRDAYLPFCITNGKLNITSVPPSSSDRCQETSPFSTQASSRTMPRPSPAPFSRSPGPTPSSATISVPSWCTRS